MTRRLTFRTARPNRTAHLLGWTLLAAVCCFLLWIAFGGAARAEDPGSLSGAGPKAAARAVGNAGTAAAGAIARDASNAATVPGYAGTNVPSATSARMPWRARAGRGSPIRTTPAGGPDAA